MRSVAASSIPSNRGFQFKRAFVGGTLQQRKARTGLLFVLPTMLFALVIFGVPTVFTAVQTVFGWEIVGGLGDFAGLTYYRAVFTDPSFWTTIRNTFLLAALSVPVTVGLGFLAALALQSSTKIWFRGAFRLIYFLPVITSSLAMAYIWRWLYNPSYGLINHVLGLVGIPPQMWLTSITQVLPSLAVIYIWARFGFGMLIFIAGLEGIPQDYYDAAAIDGATTRQSILHITIPLLNRQFVLMPLLETISALKVFDIVFAATQGGPGDASRTTVMYIYETAFTLYEFGRASVAALVLFLFIVLLTLVQRRILGRASD